jgi:hypothetical protein
MRQLEARFVPLIERALAYELGPADIPATRALLRCTLERSRRFERGGMEAPAEAG